MKATQLLHNLGQSLWLDNITRDLLNNGTLKRYIDELSVTGLTSNPTIFEHTIKSSAAYDAAIREGLAKGRTGEALFFELALDDLTRAADLFRRVHDGTNGVDGWVSLEVSPLLAHETAKTVAAAKELSSRAGRPNLFIKIPGTKEGLPAIEEAIFAGVPVSVTLLFSREQYVATAEAYLRGIERRIAAGFNPQVGSVASMFISRWDAAVAGKVPLTLGNRLGIAVAGRIYKAYVDQLGNPRWQRAYNHGARPQRLLWASTGSTGEPLYLDVIAMLAQGIARGERPHMPRVIGGRDGIGSKDFTPAMVKATFDEMSKPEPKNSFTVGIDDDITHGSLPIDPYFTIETDRVTRCVFYGLGADGTVGGNKNSVKIIAQDVGLYAQGYFVYDSHKSGAQTISHLRFGPEPIHAPYLIASASFVACHQHGFLARGDVLRILSAAASGWSAAMDGPMTSATVDSITCWRRAATSTSSFSTPKSTPTLEDKPRKRHRLARSRSSPPLENAPRAKIWQCRQSRTATCTSRLSQLGKGAAHAISELTDRSALK